VGGLVCGFLKTRVSLARLSIKVACVGSVYGLQSCDFHISPQLIRSKFVTGISDASFNFAFFICRSAFRMI
jgi:hypothetical protein